MDGHQENKVLVIGGGLMGSAAAWELALSGKSVMLIEQQAEQYENGSSYGEARVTRSLGVQDDIFTYLKEKSVDETKILMDFLGEPMEKIYTTTPVTYLYPIENKEDVDELVMNNDYTLASTGSEAGEKLGMNVQNEIVIREHKKYSGTLNPSALIRYMHEGIRKKGGEVLYNHEITGIEKGRKEFSIKVHNRIDESNRSIEYKKLVIAAGPYSADLLKDIAPYFGSLITTKRLYLAFFKPDADNYLSLSDEQKDKITNGFPVARFDDEIFYGMVEKYDENGIPLFKVGGHNRRFDIKDQFWGEAMPDSEINWSRNQLASYLERLNIPIKKDQLDCVNTYSCVYSLTHNEVPFVTRLVDLDHEIDPNCVIIAGLSGIGAKGTLCYGKIAADLINETSEDDPMYLLTRNLMGDERLRFNLEEQGLM